MELRHDLPGTSKKGEDMSMQVGPSSCSQQVQGLAFSLLIMYSFKLLSSFSLPPLDGLYQVYHDLYHLFSSLEYGDLCLLSYTYILGHALGMQAFTFLLYVLALCMMYVYIYLLAPLRCDCHSPCHLRQVMPNFCRESKVTLFPYTTLFRSFYLSLDGGRQVYLWRYGRNLGQILGDNQR